MNLFIDFEFPIYSFSFLNRTEMVYLVDQDKIRRNTLTQIHSDY